MRIPIYLDWDGVLSDSLELYLDLYRSLCQRYGKVLPVSNAEEFRLWYEADWEINFRELGLTRNEYLDFCQYYPTVLDYSQAELFPGAVTAIKKLAQCHDLVVVSAAPTKNIHRHLEQLDLLQHFVLVTGSDDASTGKTERLARLGAQLGTTKGVMVGDTDLDIVAGKANHLVTVGVTYGWISVQRVKASNPDFLVSCPGDLEDCLWEAVKLEAVHCGKKPA